MTKLGNLTEGRTPTGEKINPGNWLNYATGTAMLAGAAAVGFGAYSVLVSQFEEKSGVNTSMDIFGGSL